jgi:hypothetical protein
MTFEKQIEQRKKDYTRYKNTLSITKEEKERERKIWINNEKFNFPNSYSYIYSLVDSKVRYSTNLDLITSARAPQSLLKRINGRYLPEQSKLIEYETYSLFTKCQKYLDKDFYFFSQRAIKIFNGRYWLAHQYSIPVIIDKDNRLLSYLSDVFIVKKYEGEPYQSTVGLRLKAKNRGNRTKAKFLKQLFKDIKMEELVYFESKEENRLALPYIFSGRLSDAEIEEKCNLRKGRVNSIKRKLNKNLCELFPESEHLFEKNLPLTISYLRQMFHNII